MKQINWSKLLKVLIAVLTAIAGSLGIVAAYSHEYFCPHPTAHWQRARTHRVMFTSHHSPSTSHCSLPTSHCSVLTATSHDSKVTSQRDEKRKRREFYNFLRSSVPRPGVEPGWVAPLVFETSASTDSAIWASLFERRCKGSAFF